MWGGEKDGNRVTYGESRDEKDHARVSLRANCMRGIKTMQSWHSAPRSSSVLTVASEQTVRAPAHILLQVKHWTCLAKSMCMHSLFTLNFCKALQVILQSLYQTCQSVWSISMVSSLYQAEYFEIDAGVTRSDWHDQSASVVCSLWFRCKSSGRTIECGRAVSPSCILEISENNIVVFKPIGLTSVGYLNRKQ